MISDSRGGEIDALFQQAVVMRRQGNAAAAAALCAEVLRADARHVNALHLRALLALDAGDTARGIDLLNRALEVDASHPLVHANLGNAWVAAGAPARALACFERALGLKPDLAVAHYNRGNALRALGRLEAALASYDAALACEPGHLLALNNRGLTLHSLGRLAEAEASFRSALNAGPGYRAARENLSVVLLDMQRPAAALAMLDSAPVVGAAGAGRSARTAGTSTAENGADEASAWCLRGTALLALDRPAAAVDAYTRALEVDPAHLEARLNRASALQRLGQFDAALADCDDVLERRVDWALALVHSGNVLLQLQRPEAALARYTRAAGVAEPQAAAGALRVEALFGRAAALVALKDAKGAAAACHEVLVHDPMHAAALAHLYQLRRAACDWQDETLPRRVHAALLATHQPVNPLVMLLFDDPPLQLACARALTAARHPPDASLGPGALRAAAGLDAPLRVAYVSADFGNHPVAHLLIGALEQHDRRQVEVLGVSLRAPGGGGEFEARMRAAFDRHLDVSALSDRDAAQALRAAGVDIAVDLMGFTDGMRLGIFAHRAAPVQVGFLGYAGTVGAPYIDYLLADSIVIPEGSARWYTEAVVRLPHCYLPTDDRQVVAAAPSRAALGLPSDALVLCAFTQAHKITPELFDIWVNLLHAVPSSVLWMRAGEPASERNLARVAASRGVPPHRLLFAPRVADRAQHLARQALADLVLDTLPYNGHSTTCEALWAGVPVLTCAGRSFASRVAASALTAVGLPELITPDLAAYQRLAETLLQAPERLRGLRTQLAHAGRRSPLFDTAGYTRGLESAFLEMRRRARSGEPSAGFDVARPPSPA